MVCGGGGGGGGGKVSYVGLGTISNLISVFIYKIFLNPRANR